MHEYLPLLIVGGIIGLFTTIFLIAYAILRKQKEDMTDRDRNMSDKEIVIRLLRYAKPYRKNFIAVFFLCSPDKVSFKCLFIPTGVTLEISTSCETKSGVGLDTPYGSRYEISLARLSVKSSKSSE